MADSLAVQFGAEATTLLPGNEAHSLLTRNYDLLRAQIGRSGEIPADAKGCMARDIDAAQKAMSTAVSDGGITDVERTDLVRRAMNIGLKGDRVVAAQQASPNAPVAGDTYRAILCK